MHRETPTIIASTYAANPLDFGNAVGIAHFEEPKFIVDNGPLQRRIQAGQQNHQLAQLIDQFNQPNMKESAVMARRLVQVLIADPNENVPVADSLLYRGDPVLTDATDQELYFDIDIKSLLAAHNEKRAKLIDKKVKDRTEYLEPAKVRDLKMVVVTIATF